MDRTERDRLLVTLYDELRGHRQPVALTELVAAVQLASPLPVKDPREAVRRALTGGLRAIRVGGGNWVLLERALEGAVFRCTPHAAELKSGCLYIFSRFSPFLPAYPAPVSTIRVIDAATGAGFAAEVDDSPLCALDLTVWYRSHHFSAGDSILVAVSYADGVTFRLTHEPHARRDPAVAGRTRAFADAVLELLPGWRREEVPLAALVQAVLARHMELLQAPPDDYRDLFARDGRFRLLEGGVVSSANYRRPIDYLHLFPRWGRGSFQALNPGYPVPLEFAESGQAEPAGHWLRLVSVEVVALDPAARRTTLRVHADSSAGAFHSDVELAVRPWSKAARSLLVTLRQRFKLLVAGQAPAGHGRGAAAAVAIRNEPVITRQIADFLRSLGEAAEMPADTLTGADAPRSPGRTRLEFTGPLAS